MAKINKEGTIIGPMRSSMGLTHTSGHVQFTDEDGAVFLIHPKDIFRLSAIIENDCKRVGWKSLEEFKKYLFEES